MMQTKFLIADSHTVAVKQRRAVLFDGEAGLKPEIDRRQGQHQPSGQLAAHYSARCTKSHSTLMFAEPQDTNRPYTDSASFGAKHVSELSEASL